MNGLDALQQALDAVREGRTTAAQFAATARAQAALLAALPPRFGEVLNQLLDQLESSALFTEESCSFSQRDLLDGVQAWVDKARERV